MSELESKVLAIPEEANKFLITDNREYEFADGFVKRIKGLKDAVNDTFEPVINKCFQAHKEAIAQKKKHLQPLDDADTTMRGKMLEYTQVCERKRRKEQAEKEAIARKQAEEQALADAENADTPEEAEEIIEEAIENRPTVFIPPIQPKLQGTHTRKEWQFKIINEAKINREYLKPDESFIRQTVKKKGKLAEQLIGGVKVFIKESLVVRGG